METHKTFYVQLLSLQIFGHGWPYIFTASWIRCPDWINKDFYSYIGLTCKSVFKTLYLLDIAFHSKRRL